MQDSADISLETALESALDWWNAVGVETPKIAAAKARPRKAPPRTAKAPSAKNPSVAGATAQRRNSVQAEQDSPDDKARLTAATAAAKSAKDLDGLQTAMRSFDAGVLSDNAAQCVFARGNPKARLMVIGEAPSRDEDTKGAPLIGRSGQLFDRMLAAIGLSEETVYITSAVNWRPPGDRNPSSEEIALCRPFLHRHIELAAPDVLLILGGVSLTAMTDLTGIMKNRGVWQSLNIAGRDIPALPIYHPAFLRRRPELKKDAWRDLLALHAHLAGADSA